MTIQIAGTRLFTYYGRNESAVLNHLHHLVPLLRGSRKCTNKRGPGGCLILARRLLANNSTTDRTYVPTTPPPLIIVERKANGSTSSRTTVYKENDDLFNTWNVESKTENDSKRSLKHTVLDMISHFLPAKYPESVGPGYTRFVGYSFAASAAGSAAMVLSTQTLLLAVGVVGSGGAGSLQTASVMAGALNWVLKDGIGQLGGVLFASHMGQTKRFDSNPKKWRMFAALSLDAASLVEILCPMITSTAVLPAACVANIMKNVAFLTAGASRAAIHQTLAISGNLGDVTAKSGSQSIAAGLLGTSGGVFLSWLLGQDPNSYILGFCMLSLAHQTFNFLSLQSITMTHFDRQRLFILLSEYIETKMVPTPVEVAKKEIYFPLSKEINGDAWLFIGKPISTFCDSPGQFRRIQSTCEGENYILSTRGGVTNLVFEQSAKADDEILGMFHALLLKAELGKTENSSDVLIHELTIQTKEDARKSLPHLMEKLRDQKWKMDLGLTSVEGDGAVRYNFS